MGIQIIADSTCDIDSAWVRGTNLKILPLSISADGQNYLDGETIRVADVYALMRRGVVPQTSQISYARTSDVFRACLEAGDDIVYIAFSSAMSGCFSLARMVADELQAEFPRRKIAVIDSRGGSGATGLMVMQALKMEKAGYSFADICAEVQFMAGHVELVFSMDRLDWLAKGGRLPKIVGSLGGILGIHPILEVEKGRIVLKGMVRGQKNVVQTVAAKVIAMAVHFPDQLISVVHADDLPGAKALGAAILNRIPNCVMTFQQIGGVLSAHLGPKGIGVFCLNQRPAHYCLTGD